MLSIFGAAENYSWVKILLIIYFVCMIIKLHFLRKESMKKHPAIEYDPEAQKENWRWSTPPPEVDLVKEDFSQKSRLYLPAPTSYREIGTSIFGYGFLLFLVLK